MNVTLHPAIAVAYKVLDGGMLSRSEALRLAGEVSGEDVLDLISLANKVRKKYGGGFSACSILNVKSGKCGQNCRFCAQSAHYRTESQAYGLLPADEVLSAARKAYDAGIATFGYVASGYGFTSPTPEFRKMLDTFDLLHSELPELRICVSVGILSRETARLLAEHHVYRYNMNLQTNPERYSELISDTHSIKEKIDTIKYLQKYGVSICCGGIFGLGESWADRVKMAIACRELKVDGCPLNVLLPIKGTPLENLPVMEPADVAKAFSIFRLVNPGKMLKFAAGRETVMKDFQGLLMLAGMNSMITGGYLTTRGRSVEDDMKFIEQLNGF